MAKNRPLSLEEARTKLPVVEALLNMMEQNRDGWSHTSGAGHTIRMDSPEAAQLLANIFAETLFNTRYPPGSPGPFVARRTQESSELTWQEFGALFYKIDGAEITIQIPARHFPSDFRTAMVDGVRWGRWLTRASCTM